MLSKIRISLQTKFILALTLLLISIMFVVTLFTISRQKQALVKEMQSSGIATARTVQLAVNDIILSSDIFRVGMFKVGQFIKNIGKSEKVLYVMVEDNEGRVRTHSNFDIVEEISMDDLMSKKALEALNTEEPMQQYYEDRDGEVVYEVALPIDKSLKEKNWGVVRIGLSTKQMMVDIAKSRNQIMLISIVPILLGILSSIFLARTITRPIKRLVQGAMAIAGGDLEQEIAIKTKDEIKDLADAFNQMTRSLRQMRKVEKLVILGELAAGVAHEVRNPLTSIKGFTQFLMEDLKPDEEKKKEFMGIIVKEVDRLNSVVEELLDFAKPTESKFAEIDVDTVLDKTISLIELEASVQKVNITKEASDGLPLIYADGEKLEQAFLDLMINGLQAMPKGGDFLIKTSYKNVKQAVEIQFIDSGVGIPEECLDKIFDPFFTTKKEGTGLGLSIVQRIINEYGGFITLKSKLGKGTTFMVELPVRTQSKKDSLDGKPS